MHRFPWPLEVVDHLMVQERLSKGRHIFFYSLGMESRKDVTNESVHRTNVSGHCQMKGAQ